MASPVNIRVATQFPFPALVRGRAPITVNKSFGTWTVGFDIIDLAQGVPQPANYSNDYLIYYDSVSNTFLRLALSSLPGVSPTQRIVQTALDLPITINDHIMTVNIAAPLTITLPLAASRAGRPITVVDVAGNWDTNNVTFNTTGGDTIAGLASGALKGTAKRQGFTFLPLNDGISSGYALI